MLDDRSFLALPTAVSVAAPGVFDQFSQNNPVLLQASLFRIFQRYGTVQHVKRAFADTLDELIIGRTNERRTLTPVRVTECIQESHVLLRVSLSECGDARASFLRG